MEYTRRGGPPLDVSQALFTAPFFSMCLRVRYSVPGFIASNPNSAILSIISYPYEFHSLSSTKITGCAQFLGRASPLWGLGPWYSQSCLRPPPSAVTSLLFVFSGTLVRVAPLLLGWPAVLLEEHGGLLRCRDLPYPVGYLPFPVTQLVNRIVHLPRPLGDEYGQVAVFADDQVIRETAVELPTSVYDPPLYLFPTHRPPPSLGSCAAANLSVSNDPILSLH